MERFRLPPAWSVLVSSLLALSGCADRPPNVILISLDTVRADHLSVYGYPAFGQADH